ncbi:aminoacyl-tRNA hydrolase [Synergistes jonesii]|uniref:Peptidyl-tRNA hydrolase n=1 Tax=Synergistes jonesii TaxID=2754 RepID=A0A073INE2_9BACT|nr:aminoacyl-tRNA hydrolase [Synergistes jonesii]KEJ91274.1 peptidyl-tRNA hydrolase [Synergistes jonesii]OFB60349.1 peptidyl-tRNA hydrolase [Synergistes jonesii]OFB61075.1 peptidyl-tRNA hydrolase [Synergistes jonesii]OFB65830.1 peptidyl-tRNA hydrolase [Synergistes jonesii]OFB66560.1 peptidyl-tRNA hydrolase [Synergistes jonesii]
MKLIVGLGNPGYEYVWTRHNAGWLIVDSFVARLALHEPQIKFRGAYWGPALCFDERVAFLEPHTYMNLSGLSVSEAVRYGNIELSDLLIISDDSALPFGRIRMRKSGSAGGQNGLKSILGALGTLDVPRLRIGTGSPEGKMEMKEWVLGKIPPEQRREWHKIEDAAWEALGLWIREGIDKAMTKANGFRLNDGE